MHTGVFKNDIFANQFTIHSGQQIKVQIVKIINVNRKGEI